MQAETRVQRRLRESREGKQRQIQQQQMARAELERRLQESSNELEQQPAACGKCAYYAGQAMNEVGQFLSGICRRYPPRIRNEGMQWPHVQALDWCGEFNLSRLNRLGWDANEPIIATNGICSTAPLPS